VHSGCSWLSTKHIGSSNTAAAATAEMRAADRDDASHCYDYRQARVYTKENGG